MWWSRFFLLIFFIIVGCKMSPLYKKIDNEPWLVEEFAKIDIKINADEYEHEFKNILSQLLNPLSIYRKKEFLLKLTLENQQKSIAILQDSQVSRYDIRVIAKFQFYDNKNNSLIESGYVNMVSSYDVTPSEYAVHTAKIYSIDSNLNEIARDLKNKLAVIMINYKNENKSKPNK